MDVVRGRQALPQGYLKRKAKLLGMDRLRFCDLMAPLLEKHELRIICVRSEHVPDGVDRWDEVVELGASMPAVEGCNKQDYAVLFVIGVAVDK